MTELTYIRARKNVEEIGIALAFMGIAALFVCLIQPIFLNAGQGMAIDQSTLDPNSPFVKTANEIPNMTPILQLIELSFGLVCIPIGCSMIVFSDKLARYGVKKMAGKSID